MEALRRAGHETGNAELDMRSFDSGRDSPSCPPPYPQVRVKTDRAYLKCAEGCWEQHHTSMALDQLQVIAAEALAKGVMLFSRPEAQRPRQLGLIDALTEHAIEQQGRGLGRVGMHRGGPYSATRMVADQPRPGRTPCNRLLTRTDSTTELK